MQNETSEAQNEMASDVLLSSLFLELHGIALCHYFMPVLSVKKNAYPHGRAVYSKSIRKTEFNAV